MHFLNRAEAAEKRVGELLSLLREAKDCILSDYAEAWAFGKAANLIDRIDKELERVK